MGFDAVSRSGLLGALLLSVGGLGLGLEQATVDLAQRDRERLLLDVGVEERTDVLEQALAELRVVGVDLARAWRSRGRARTSSPPC